MQKLTKLKHITIGVIIGATAMATPSIASEIKEYILYKADYKIIVNGQQYSNDELPILNYKGVTYTPLKAIGELLNSNVQWNAEVGQVEIGKKVEEKVEQSNQTSTNKSTNLGDTYFNDFKFVVDGQILDIKPMTINNDAAVSIDDIQKLSPKLRVDYNKETQMITFSCGDDELKIKVGAYYYEDTPKARFSRHPSFRPQIINGQVYTEFLRQLETLCNIYRHEIDHENKQIKIYSDKIFMKT